MVTAILLGVLVTCVTVFTISPFYNADIFPFMRTFIEHLTERNFQNRTVGFIENGSWAPLAGQIGNRHLGASVVFELFGQLLHRRLGMAVNGGVSYRACGYDKIRPERGERKEA